MKGRTMGSWVCTALVAMSFLSGGAAYLLRVPDPVNGVLQLKALGAVALLVPGFPARQAAAQSSLRTMMS